ncbi:MAG: DUF799 family lipoprotein [Bacteroidota bacterium]|nr:DUF799 family lipoprotein [Bacteroidota bacterium]
MKKLLLYIIIVILIVLSSCSTLSDVPKSTAYKSIYDNKPLTILLMPPINRSTNVEAKEYFHSTLNSPLANSGYYVIPPFLSMEILKQESAYDSELFLNSELTKFRKVFGADMALFTIIHRWDKSSLAAKVHVKVEYIIKSTKTNDIIYTRKGDVTYDTSVNTNTGGLLGAVVDATASAINTAATKYVDVARACNTYTLQDLPAGKYSPDFGMDGEEMSGKKEFRVTLK